MVNDLTNRRGVLFNVLAQRLNKATPFGAYL